MAYVLWANETRECRWTGNNCGPSAVAAPVGEPPPHAFMVPTLPVVEGLRELPGEVVPIEVPIFDLPEESQ